MTKRGYKSPPKDVELPEKPPQPPPSKHYSRVEPPKPWPAPPQQPHACTCSQQQRQPRPFVEINPQIATGTKAVLMLDGFSFFDVWVEPEPVMGLLSVKVRGLQVKNGRWADLFCFQHQVDGKAEVAAYKVLSTIQAAIEHWNRATTEPRCSCDVSAQELGGLERLHAAMDEYEMHKVVRSGKTLVSLACDSCDGAEVAWVANSPTGTRSVHWICPECEKSSSRLIEVGVSSGP